jgi:hypothetical protein
LTCRRCACSAAPGPIARKNANRKMAGYLSTAYDLALA